MQMFSQFFEIFLNLAKMYYPKSFLPTGNFDVSTSECLSQEPGAIPVLEEYLSITVMSQVTLYIFHIMTENSLLLIFFILECKTSEARAAPHNL